MGFTEVLTIVFVVLKLLGIINWSWWLVLLPEIIAGVVYICLAAYSIYLTSKTRREMDKFIEQMESERHKMFKD